MAWLTKSPTVIPIVTEIIAAPMSIPFPDAVIPPACDNPDYKSVRGAEKNKTSQNRLR